MVKKHRQALPHGFDFAFDLLDIVGGGGVFSFQFFTKLCPGSVSGYSFDVFFVETYGSVMNANVKTGLIAGQEFAVAVKYLASNTGQQYGRAQHEPLGIIHVVLVGEDLYRDQTDENNGKEDGKNQKENKKTAIKHLVGAKG